MTREEIIEHLDSIVGTYEILLGHGVNSDILDVDDIEAIKEAISALSENKGDLISRERLINEWDDLGRRYAMPTTPIHKRAFREFPSTDAISIDQANAMIKSYVSHYEANKCFDGMTNREIISEFVERDDSFAIMVDEVNGTVNIELSLDFWNASYKRGET